MTRKRTALLVIALGIPLSSCGYRIAIESTDTTTTSTTASTSPPRITPTTIYLGDGCTSSNHAELLKLSGEAKNAWKESTSDGPPTSDEWQATSTAYRKYRSFLRGLDVPTLALEQDALVDAIADFLEAYNRYWESGQQDLSVNNYITAYGDAEYDFWKAFEKACR